MILFSVNFSLQTTRSYIITKFILILKIWKILLSLNLKNYNQGETTHKTEYIELIFLILKRKPLNFSKGILEYFH